MLLNIYTLSEGEDLLTIYTIQTKDNFIIQYDMHLILKTTLKQKKIYIFTILLCNGSLKFALFRSVLLNNILTNIIFYVEKEHKMYAILHRTSEKICHNAIF